MNKLIGTSYIPQLSTVDHIDIMAQIDDTFEALASDLSQIMTEWNQEVYTTLGTLPQGVSDTRWNLTDTISPKVNNLDAANIFVDTDASATADSGRFWDLTNLRPKTIKESINSLYTELSSSVDTLRSEVTSIGSSGLTAEQIARIGDNIFDSSKTSLSTSLDGLTQSNNKHAVQLAKDLYDVTSWSWTADGSGALTNYSVKDMLNAVLTLHGGLWDDDISLTHSGIGTTMGAMHRYITAGTNEETTSTSEVVVGGLTFDPAEFGDTLGSLEIYFEGELNYIAAGAAGGGSLLLYDMGAPGSTGVGTLRSTLDRDHTGSNLPDRVRVELIDSASPGVDTDTILNTVRVYEIRIKTNGAGAAGDVLQMIWGGLVIQNAGV